MEVYKQRPTLGRPNSVQSEIDTAESMTVMGSRRSYFGGRSFLIFSSLLLKAYFVVHLFARYYCESVLLLTVGVAAT